MFYDLNVPYTTNHSELQRTLAFLAERTAPLLPHNPQPHIQIANQPPPTVGYNTIALSHTITGKLPTDLTSPIPHPLPFATPPGLHILTRLTLPLSTPSLAPRLPSLLPHYTLLALRPSTPQTLLLACQSPHAHLISLDLTSTRLFALPRKTLALAVQNGLRFEICYAGGVLDAAARRNLISNATALVRATQGRGVVVSSEARGALGCRGPWDVGNLAAGWGLGGERGREAVGREARGVVVRAEGMRGGWRGVVDVIVGGEREVGKGGVQGGGSEKGKGGKRKAEVLEEGKEEVEKPVSKREMKRRAKKARQEGRGGAGVDEALAEERPGGSAKDKQSETAPATDTPTTADGGPKDAPKGISDTVD
ncbi:hypothetical protein MMC11_005834 [Xylographa trunciseda]|nr:hypothetical protein [Xylographa trunciseda]